MGADRGAGRVALRPALRDRRRRRAAARAAARTRSSSPSCGSSTPTAPRPSCPATAPARRSSTCAATAGPTRTTFTIMTVAGPISADDHRRADLLRSTWAAPRPPPRTSPPAARTARGTLDAGGPRVGASSTSRSATRSARSSSAAELDDLDLGAIGPGSKANELFPNRTNVSFLAIEGCRVRARIFERGVGETLSSGHRRQRRRRHRLPARRRRARSRSSSTAASSRSRSARTSRCG